MAKLSVIGLDGVNWKILRIAMEKGLMPNMEEILEDSYTARLETTYPPVTGPAWTAIMTGENPGRTGLFDFVEHTEGGRPYTSADIDSETIYERLSLEYDVCMVNLPMSYPPKFSGQFVGSFLAPEDDYVRPESLEEEFDFSGYRKSISATDKAFNVVQAASDVAEDKEDLVEEVLDYQDFFFLLFSAPDWVMHNLYHRMLEGDERPFRPFAIIDEALGEVRERSDNLILMSDHGFKTYDTVFHVNQWLKDRGFLEVSGTMESQWVDNSLIEYGLKAVSSSRVARRIAQKIYSATEKVVPIPDNVKVRLAGALSDGIDMEESRAFCPSSDISAIYVNDDRFQGVVNAEERNELIEEILEKLPEEVQARRADEIYSGEHVDRGPDIIFTGEDHKISRGVYGKVFAEAKLNHHGRKGFFAATGENFTSPEGMHDISLYDFAPTVADLFGVEFSADGEVIPVVKERIDSASDVSDIDF
ncbi:MAG: alkaline phosphatase family protein [Candidatus Nanohaloarchaea archaeon]